MASNEYACILSAHILIESRGNRLRLTNMPSKMTIAGRTNIIVSISHKFKGRSLEIVVQRLHMLLLTRTEQWKMTYRYAAAAAQTRMSIWRRGGAACDVAHSLSDPQFVDSIPSNASFHIKEHQPSGSWENCQIRGTANVGTAKLQSVALPNPWHSQSWHCQTAVRGTAKSVTLPNLTLPNCRPWHC